MRDLIDKLSTKKIFIMPLGRKQKEFEYIFTDFGIYGYIGENNLASLYKGKPAKKLKEVLEMPDYFIIVCEEKNRERRDDLGQHNCKYKITFSWQTNL